MFGTPLLVAEVSSHASSEADDMGKGRDKRRKSKEKHAKKTGPLPVAVIEDDPLNHGIPLEGKVWDGTVVVVKDTKFLMDKAS